MQAIPRCGSMLNLRILINLSSTQLASFHSTPACNDKWKKKSNSDFKRGQQPSKNYARFATRQKRADTKRALKSLLFNCRDLGTAFQNEDQSWKAFGTSSWDTENDGSSTSSIKKGRSRSNSHRAQKIQNHRMRRKFRKGALSDDEDDLHETIFHASFGPKWFTWSFNSWNGSSRRSTPGFDWREDFYHMYGDRGKKDAANETDSEDETCGVGVGSRSDRTILGLPPNGPLKMKDVKNAFHLSALKWHPDKHQGPSQAAAEEKFKLCVNAYKSLCSAVSAA